MSETLSPSTDGPTLQSRGASAVATADMTLYGDCSRVLAETDDTDLFKQTETLILCPNCASVLSSYEQGLPAVVPHFEKYCSTCQVDLRRWCVVAVTAADKAVVDPTLLPAMTRAYWNRWFWPGITNKRDNPRKREYKRRFTKKAAEFGWNRALNCPLCRRPLTDRRLPVEDGCTELDYHHWSEKPDIGVTLCRACHAAVSFDDYDTNLEDQAHAWGFRSCNDLQIVRLALREALAVNQPLHLEMAPRLVKRYNLTHSPDEATGLIRTVLEDDDLRERFTNDLLFRGLPVDRWPSRQ